MSRRTRPLTQVDANLRPIADSELWTKFMGAYVGTNLIYGGFARPGAATSEAVWQIRRMTYDGSNNITAIEYPQDANARETADYEFIWDNRAAYTYGA